MSDLAAIVATIVAALAATGAAAGSYVSARLARRSSEDVMSSVDHFEMEARKALIAAIEAGSGRSTRGEPTEEDTHSDISIGLSDRRIIAELAHALRTPLSAIRYQADSMALSNADNQEVVSQGHNIIRFAYLCETILLTFRQLVETERQVQNLPVGTLQEMLTDLYQALRASEHNINLHIIQFPPKLPGYENSYLTTLLLPLMENAIEASGDQSHIYLEWSENDQSYTITMRNRVNKSAPQVFPPAGVSTKHDGPALGLETARRLAAMQRGGRIETSATNGMASVRVVLPKIAGADK